MKLVHTTQRSPARRAAVHAIGAISTTTRSAPTSRRKAVSSLMISSLRSKSFSYDSSDCLRSTVSASDWMAPLSTSLVRKRRRSDSISVVQIF